jgi:CBS domain containing-hemolysin-like protein
MHLFFELLGLLSFPLLVLANGVFVAAEYAFVRVRRTRVEEMVRQGKFGAQAVLNAVTDLDDTIAACQLGITFCGLALGWLGEPVVARFIEPLFASVPGPWDITATHTLAVIVSFLLITYTTVVMGELAPKALALQRAEDIALFVAGPLLVFGRVFRPFIDFMSVSGQALVRLLRLPPLPAGKAVHSVEELRALVEETEKAGVMTHEQASYAKNVFRLTDKRVRDVMVPRDKVVTLPLGASEEQVLDTARETAHTRLPVWEGELDNMVGIVNTKDLFHLFSEKGLVILDDAMYPPIFVHPDQRVGWLLELFRREKRPMAIVRDARGSFLGIVTLEDILEEIVGEIEDEHDEPDEEAPVAGPSL